MKPRYQRAAGRAAALAALGASGALIAQSISPQSVSPQSPGTQSLNPSSPNPQGLKLRPGHYQLLTTTDLTPEAAAGLSPDMLARLRQAQAHYVCILDADKAAARDKADSDRAQAGLLSGQGDRTCKVSQLSSNGNQMRFVMQCAHSTLSFEGTLATNSYRATMRTKSDQGQTTTLHLSAHRVGDCTK
jgi:hypothetical protein